MYQMIVVDDLPIIVDRLVPLFEEQVQLNLTVHKAYSAFEAIDILKRNKIDIVLTDIKMPGMEGIELLDIIRQYWPKCKVIFLTSYGEFHYAKAAISGGGFDFILKFESDDVIINSVLKAVSVIEDEYATIKQLHEAQIQKRQVTPLLQEQVLYNLLYGKGSFSQNKTQLSNLDIHVETDLPIYVLVGRIDDWTTITSTTDRKLLLYAARNIIAELLNVSVAVTSITVEEARLVCFLQPKELQSLFQRTNGFPSTNDERWERTFVFIYESIPSIQATCQDLLKLSFSFMLGKNPVMFDQLPALFDHLRSLFLSHVSSGRELRLTDQMDSSSNDTAASLAQHKIQSFIVKKIELLGHYLENGTKEHFQQLYLEIMNDIMQQSVSVFLKLEVFHSLASIFSSYFRLLSPDAALTAKIELSRLTQTNPEDLSWEEIRSRFFSIATQLFDQKEETKEQSKDNVVLWLNAYIEKHIDEDLSLTRLAEIVHLNPVYLSRLYIQTTGTGISDYVNMCRLNTSKELLKNSHYKIYEVAERVGYDSALSFIRFFKKQMNMTPQEYRHL